MNFRKLIRLIARGIEYIWKVSRRWLREQSFDMLLLKLFGLVWMFIFFAVPTFVFSFIPLISIYSLPTMSILFAVLAFLLNWCYAAARHYAELIKNPSNSEEPEEESKKEYFRKRKVLTEISECLSVNFRLNVISLAIILPLRLAFDFQSALDLRLLFNEQTGQPFFWAYLPLFALTLLGYANIGPTWKAFRLLREI